MRRVPSGSDVPRLAGGLVAITTVRIAFAVGWIGLQLALILTASRRPDGAFGFRMFPESSTIAVSLYRETDGERVPVREGTWTARDADGTAHAFSWKDRVRRPELATFDVEMHASYGAAAQLARWQAALEDVASHVPADRETRRFSLDVTVRRNGREPRLVRLETAERR